MNILIFDNYDSFTYNIVHAVRELGFAPDIYRNDCIALADIDRYEKIILSPGPGLPSESGILPDLLKHYAATKSILGVCLGHQAIGECFGAKLRNLDCVMHGLQTPIKLCDDDYIFAGLPEVFPAGRYHSWVVDKADFPADLVITAEDEKGEIMALRHASLDVHGIQFHPESILTPDGIKIINNFLKH
ncbi:MAG: anthranilate synthase component II [Muribaculaceae bacterium]